MHIRKLKIPKDLLGAAFATFLSEQLLEPFCGYLLNIEEGDAEKGLLTLLLYSEGYARLLLTDKADKLPILIGEVVKLNQHATFLRHEIGWQNDDFVTGNVSAILSFIIN